MRKLIGLWCALVVGGGLLYAQSPTLTVRAETENCPPKMGLYTFDGSAFRPALMEMGTGGVFEFEIPADGHHFYYFGAQPQQLTPIILGAEEQVVLAQTCGQRPQLQVRNSLINKEYEGLKNTFNQLGQENQKAITAFRSARQDEDKQQQAIEMLAEVDEARITLLDSLRAANPYLARIASLNTYLSFFNYGSKYADELSYFAQEYFQFVDWKDPAYGQLPWVYEGFKNYSSTLVRAFTEGSAFQAAVDPTLNAIPVGSRTEKLALGGILTVLRQRKHSAFPIYVERFITHFEAQDPKAAADLRAELEQLAAFVEGGQAPDFTQATPAGEDISLSDLRGKVVLVDFWASWCGPCRRENPNVKRIYEQYKDQGFEILGVSLDKTKDRWLQAIEQDGLEWLHVSDLQGWGNAVAQLYSVSSIPHTVLLDAEGKIIARNLRGQQLEQKLAEVFGK